LGGSLHVSCTLLERSLHGGFVIVHPHRLNNAGECHKAVTHERRASRDLLL